jgi:hypothetical protein
MKTNKEIFPILKTSCKSLGWKLNKKQSAYENLECLLNKISRIEAKIRKGNLPIEEEKMYRNTLRSSMNELGQSLTSIRALKKSLTSKMTKALVDSLESKKTIGLWTELIANLKLSERVRKESVEFEEAYEEIEANHFAKISLYNMEIERREEN